MPHKNLEKYILESPEQQSNKIVHRLSIEKAKQIHFSKEQAF